MIEKRQKTLGVSFAGGGVRALAQVAVYEALVAQGIQMSAVAGTSMGSFLAAAVALELELEEVSEVIAKADKAIAASGLFGNKALLNILPFRSQTGLVEMPKLEQVLASQITAIGEMKLSEVPLPLAIPAVDLVTGTLVVFANKPEYFTLPEEKAVFYEEDVPLIRALLASCAYPVVLTPIDLGPYQLADGGIRLNSPSTLFSRERIEYVFASRLSEEHYEAKATRRLEIALRSISILIHEQNSLTNRLAMTDSLYSLDLRIGTVFSFGHSEEVIAAGREHVALSPLILENLFVEPEPVTPEEVVEPVHPIEVEEPMTFWQRIKNFFQKVD